MYLAQGFHGESLIYAYRTDNFNDLIAVIQYLGDYPKQKLDVINHLVDLSKELDQSS